MFRAIVRSRTKRMAAATAAAGGPTAVEDLAAKAGTELLQDAPGTAHGAAPGAVEVKLDGSAVAADRPAVAPVVAKGPVFFSHSKWDDVLLFQLGYGLLCAASGGLGNALAGIWSEQAATVLPSDWIFYWVFGGVCLPVCVLLFSVAPS